MQSSKVLLLPSTGDGFGIVALVEANACGLPVITVDHKMNATCDFVKTGNGFICDLTEDDVAEKILRGLDEGKEMEKGCIESAKKYDWNIVVDIVEKFYEKISGRINP